MIVDLQQLKEPSGRVSADEDFEFEDVGGETRTMQAHVDVAYQETGGSYHFHGDVVGKFATPCHMCGQTLDYEVAGEFDVVVRRSSDPAAQMPSDHDEFIVIGPNEHEVSLNQIVYENLIVGIPMRVSCPEYESGECPNAKPETQEGEAEVDPRWEALRKLGEQS